MKKKFFSLLVALAVSLLTLLSQAAAAALTPSNFASSVTSESMAAVWVAKERRIFRKYGLEVQFILMSRSPLSVAALLAGEIDMAVIGPGHLLNAAIGGADVVGIANFIQKLDYRLMARSDIKEGEDLRGKRLAISGPGSTSHIVALSALQALGIDHNQARIGFITIPGTELNRRLALETGSVDATTLRGSIGDMYAAKGFSMLYNFKGSGLTMPQTMVVTTRRTTATKPHLVEAYLKTLIEATAYLFDPANKEAVMRMLASNLRLPSVADAEESYRSVLDSYERVPYPNPEGMKRLHGILSAMNPKLLNVRPGAVIDPSFVSRIEASGFVQSLGKKP